MTKKTDAAYDKLYFTRAAQTLRTHGILSIVFGSLGALAGLFVIALTVTASGYAYNTSDLFGTMVFASLALVFWIAPHIYMIIAGVYLIRYPKPSIARTLVIINLVIGIFTNLIILIFAIINLTEMRQYEEHYDTYLDTLE